MPVLKKALFRIVILFTITGPLLLSDINQNALHLINFLNTSCNSTLQLYKAFRDLSADFETNIAYVLGDRVSVLDALTRDGNKPVAVSEVEIYRSPPEFTISCSNASQPDKQVTRVPHNLSQIVSNKSANGGSTGGRCHPMVGQLNSTKALRVPNVVHYVFLGSDLTFTFCNYLSYRSVERFIRPNQIFVHGDHVPSGKWWNRTIDEVKNIYHVKRRYTNKAPNGQQYKYPAHISDYMRAETLLSK